MRRSGLLRLLIGRFWVRVPAGPRSRAGSSMAEQQTFFMHVVLAVHLAARVRQEEHLFRNEEDGVRVLVVARCVARRRELLRSSVGRAPNPFGVLGSSPSG